MIKCNNCQQGIEANTDGNYNSAHTTIKCPECGHIQEVF